MAQHIQELIDKIKSEGVEAAQQKAKEIEAQASRKAQEIIQSAQTQASQMIAQANETIKKNEAASRMALSQVSRDMLLKLRKEISVILNRVITQNVAGALTTEHLANIIETSIKNFLHSSTDEKDIRVTLSQEDLEKLKHGFIAKLQKELKNGIKFQSSEDIHKGFTISFDEGKSSFDFSEASLAEYLGSYLNQEIALLLKESVK